MQEAHTRARLRLPSMTIRTRCRLGFHRRLVALLAWLTLFPNIGPFPQSSHRAAMTSLLQTKLRIREDSKSLSRGQMPSSRNCAPGAGWISNHRKGRPGPFLPETDAGAWWLETGSKSSRGKFLIHIDAQDAQDFFRKRPASNAANPPIRIGAGPPGSAGVPPAFVSAQPPASPPPRSIGKHATDLLRPNLCRSRRQGGRLPHRRHTERLATAVHAGETPALPGGPHSVTALQQRTSIGIRVYSCSFVVRL